MIVVSNLNSGDNDETLIDFPLGENSKFSPKVSQSKSAFGSKSSCERPRKKCLSKKRFGYFLGRLSFWVSGTESPFIVYKKISKNKYMIELFSSLIE